MIATSYSASSIAWGALAVAAVLCGVLIDRRIYKRRIASRNRAWSEGDMARALDICLQLQFSLSPTAALHRFFSIQRSELTIASLCRNLGRIEDARYWCAMGLRAARIPTVRLSVHSLAACVEAQCGERERVGHHLYAVRGIAQRYPRERGKVPVLAVFCERAMGQLDRACDVLHEAFCADDAPLELSWRYWVTVVLADIGRFDDALRLSEWLLKDPHRESDQSWRPGEAYGVDAALTAAREASRWDLFDVYLGYQAGATDGTPAMTIRHLGGRAVRAAHDSDPTTVSACVREMAEAAARYPRDVNLRLLQLSCTATAWKGLGRHEQALEALAQLPGIAAAPIVRSELAALAADCLEAAGETSAAQAKRDEARQLAPHAYWNRPPGVPSTLDPIAAAIVEACVRRLKTR